ncbi:MAG: SDR family NAD(P)-dependent oxidoreductase [Pseudomonadota bacterium]
MGKLDGRVAVVTGGGGGLGAGIGRCLAQEGAKIIVSDISQTLADQVAKELQDAGFVAHAITTDVREAEQTSALFEFCINEFGQVDILVSNAGVDGLPKGDDPPTPLLENVTDDEWDIVMDVNLKGVFLTARAFIPYFKEQKAGRIINIASVAGRQGLEFLAPYAASKAAVISLSQSMALQLAPYHVNVNTVCPGIIWTPMWDRLANYLSKANPAMSGASPQSVFDAVVQQMIPFGTPQTAEDIGNTVAFLASDDASEITAQAINVCGGIRMN